MRYRTRRANFFKNPSGGTQNGCFRKSDHFVALGPSNTPHIGRIEQSRRFQSSLRQVTPSRHEYQRNKKTASTIQYLPAGDRNKKAISLVASGRPNRGADGRIRN
jgi:hypothetical protein